jgi:hypothetical protein
MHEIPFTVLSGDLNVSPTVQAVAMQRVQSVHKANLPLAGRLRLLKAFWISNKKIDIIPNDLNDVSTKKPAQRSLSDSKATPCISEEQGMRRGKTVIIKDYISAGHYRMLQTLGTGSFAQVRLAIDTTTDEYIAIKLVSKRDLSKNTGIKAAVDNEIELMKVLP